MARPQGNCHGQDVLNANCEEILRDVQLWRGSSLGADHTNLLNEPGSSTCPCQILEQRVFWHELVQQENYTVHLHHFLL